MTDTLAPQSACRHRSPTGIALSSALKFGWIEFWYQPKIDLCKRQVIGAEIFARLKHPAFGVLPPSSFMPGAEAASLMALTEQALLNALETGAKLSRTGINLPITINVPVTMLGTYPFSHIIESNRPDSAKWAGLIFDIPEQYFFEHPQLIARNIEKLQPHGVRVATDDFGRCLLTQLGLKDLSPSKMTLERALEALTRFVSLGIEEIKLDRNLVGECRAHKRRASIRRAVIDLAHAIGTKVVGIGIERRSEIEAFQRMGCDIGQGFVFAQPMAQGDFISLLQAKRVQ